MNYKPFFVDGWVKDIREIILVSHFIRGASLASWLRHLRCTKFYLRNHVSLGYFESSVASMFGITHFDGKTLASCSWINVVSLSKVASATVSSFARSDGDFHHRSSHSAAYRYTQTLRALLSAARFFNNDVFVEDRLKRFLMREVLLTCAMKRTVLDVFLKYIKLFFYESSDQWKTAEHFVLIGRWPSNNQIRTLFLRSTTAAS